jgi:hypothetical protein
MEGTDKAGGQGEPQGQGSTGGTPPSSTPPPQSTSPQSASSPTPVSASPTPSSPSPTHSSPKPPDSEAAGTDGDSPMSESRLTPPDLTNLEGTSVDGPDTDDDDVTQEVSAQVAADAEVKSQTEIEIPIVCLQDASDDDYDDDKFEEAMSESEDGNVIIQNEAPNVAATSTTSAWIKDAAGIVDELAS